MKADGELAIGLLLLKSVETWLIQCTICKIPLTKPRLCLPAFVAHNNFILLEDIVRGCWKFNLLSLWPFRHIPGNIYVTVCAYEPTWRVSLFTHCSIGLPV